MSSRNDPKSDFINRIIPAARLSVKWIQCSGAAAPQGEGNRPNLQEGLTDMLIQIVREYGTRGMNDMLGNAHKQRKKYD